jgi:XrtJ-associated TM-motif-TM protein
MGRTLYREGDRKKSEDTMNLKKSALALAVMFAMALPLRAQTGCDDSPEDPTIALALVGCAGALATMAWARVKARRNSS